MKTFLIDELQKQEIRDIRPPYQEIFEVNGNISGFVAFEKFECENYKRLLYYSMKRRYVIESKSAICLNPRRPGQPSSIGFEYYDNFC